MKKHFRDTNSNVFILQATVDENQNKEIYNKTLLSYTRQIQSSIRHTRNKKH